MVALCRKRFRSFKKEGQMKGIDMIRMVDIYVMEDEDYEGWLENFNK